MLRTAALVLLLTAVGGLPAGAHLNEPLKQEANITHLQGKSDERSAQPPAPHMKDAAKAQGQTQQTQRHESDDPFDDFQTGDWIAIIATFVGFLQFCALVATIIYMDRSAKQQARAYLSVVIGAAIYQEISNGLRFEARPQILNNGATPAYNVRFQIMARVISDKAASNFRFSAPGHLPISQASIGPKESRIMRAVVRKFVPHDLEVPIALGLGAALWAWGVVHYEDAFGAPRYTQFCQRLYWIPGSPAAQVFGTYDPQFGKST